MISIKKRSKPVKDNMLSWYLDMYIDGKRSYDFLGLKTYAKPKSQIERDHNNEIRILVDSKLAKRQIELLAGEHNIIPKARQKINFLAYMDQFEKSYTIMSPKIETVS